MPFRANAFGGAAALYMLYHLEDPVRAVAECHRVLRPGGLFAACAPSMYDSPELQSVLPGYGVPSTFDSENAPEIVGSVFGEIEIDAWDGPYVRLPDREATHSLPPRSPFDPFCRGAGLRRPRHAAHSDQEGRDHLRQQTRLNRSRISPLQKLAKTRRFPP